MDDFTELDATRFLAKEWLVKIDAAAARPYLFKFYADTDARACLLITDTKTVWFEALDARHFAQRWRRLNRSTEDDAAAHAEFTAMHTMHAMQSCVFSAEAAPDADLAVELRTSAGRTWRWACDALSPKSSAAVLSAQLILPLLSVANLAFSSADPVSELSTQDLEQAVDRVARTARRAQDVHVRQTIARPRVTTTLRRMSAVFHFADPIPPIISTLEEDNAGAEGEGAGAGDVAMPPARAPSPPAPAPLAPRSPQPHRSPPPKPDSATEPESDAEVPARTGASQSGPSLSTALSTPQRDASSSPPRGAPAAKKAKTKPSRVVPEESSSGEEARTAAARTGGVRVRQPLKRGGRRF